MKIIKSKKNNLDIILDSDWADFLSGQNIILTGDKRKGQYAMIRNKINGKFIDEFLHNIVMDPIPVDMMVDHRNGNSLDNRRENLRICSKYENSLNRRGWVVRKTSSKYKGVCFDKSRGKWIAGIKVNYKRINLGRFDSEQDAARAHNEAALKYHGEFARLNIIED